MTPRVVEHNGEYFPVVVETTTLSAFGDDNGVRLYINDANGRRRQLMFVDIISFLGWLSTNLQLAAFQNPAGMWEFRGMGGPALNNSFLREQHQHAQRKREAAEQALKELRILNKELSVPSPKLEHAIALLSGAFEGTLP